MLFKLIMKNLCRKKFFSDLNIFVHFIIGHLNASGTKFFQESPSQVLYHVIMSREKGFKENLVAFMKLYTST